MVDFSSPFLLVQSITGLNQVRVQQVSIKLTDSHLEPIVGSLGLDASDNILGFLNLSSTEKCSQVTQDRTG